MGILDIFTRSTKKDAYFPHNSNDMSMFEQVFGIAKNNITPQDALSIPVVNACLSRISDIIASTEVRLYKKTKKGIELVNGDKRVKLLNTKIDGGRMSSFEFKKLLINDYFLKGDSYFYIKRKGNVINDLVYLPNVHVRYNHDVFNKVYHFEAEGRNLLDYQLFRVSRNSTNGVSGKSITEESGLHFLIILKTMDRLLKDVNRGFLPKGFFKLDKNIRDMDKLREHIARLLKDEQAGYMIFNQGIEFEPLEKKKDSEKEAAAATAELNKITSIFGVPVSLLNGNSNEEDKYNFINFTILPLLSAIESSLNRDLLLEVEQDKYFFAFDTKELLKGNLYERYKAYEVGIKNNILSMDEVRAIENMEPLDFGFYKMSIADAFYFKDKNLLVNVNSGVALDLDNVEITTDPGQMQGGFKPMNDFSDKGGSEASYLNKHKSQQGTDPEANVEEATKVKGGEKEDEDKSLRK